MGYIIEPCCCERQLPQLIKNRQMQAGESFAFFSTGGDVLMSHLLKSVSYLAGETHTLLIAVPEIDIEGLRTLCHYMSRGWTKSLLLVTQQPQDELISGELAEHLDKVQYASDPMVLDGMMAIMGETERPSVIIQGAVLTKIDFSLCHYAVYCGRNKDVINGAIGPLMAKLHVKARTLGDSPIKN